MRTKEIIISQLKELKVNLHKLRFEYDECDANKPAKQNQIQQEITKLIHQIKEYENFIQKLKGE